MDAPHASPVAVTHQLERLRSEISRMIAATRTLDRKAGYRIQENNVALIVDFWPKDRPNCANGEIDPSGSYA